MIVYLEGVQAAGPIQHNTLSYHDAVRFKNPKKRIPTPSVITGQHARIAFGAEGFVRRIVRHAYGVVVKRYGAKPLAKKPGMQQCRDLREKQHTRCRDGNSKSRVVVGHQLLPPISYTHRTGFLLRSPMYRFMFIQKASTMYTISGEPSVRNDT